MNDHERLRDLVSGIAGEVSGLKEPCEIKRYVDSCVLEVITNSMGFTILLITWGGPIIAIEVSTKAIDNPIRVVGRSWGDAYEVVVQNQALSEYVFETY